MVGGEGYPKAMLQGLLIIIGCTTAIIISVGIGVNMYINMNKTN